MEVTDRIDSAEVPPFTNRLVVMETPEIIDRLRQEARVRGCSVSVQVRQAIRYYISALGPEPDQMEGMRVACRLSSVVKIR